MRINKILALTILLISVLLLAVGCSSGGGSEASATTNEDNTIKEINTIDAFGVVKADEMKNIVLDFQAYIEDVYVIDGQQVKKGDNLVRLNLAEINQELTLKKLELEAAEKELAEENSDIKMLTNDLSVAKDSLEKARTDLENNQQLFESGSISLNRYQELKRNVQLKENEVKNLNLSLEELKYNKVKVQDGAAIKVRQLEKSIEILEEKLMSRDYLEDNNIVASMEKGVVFGIECLPGDVISPPQKLLSIMDMNSLSIEAEVPEEFIKDIRIGADTLIVPLSDTSKEYHGKVVSISRMAEKRTGETIIPVVISIDDIDEFLLPNYNVDVRISR